MDHQEQPPIKPPGEHDSHKWVAYYCTVQRILGQQDKTDLNLAMRQAATACGLNGQHRTQDDTTPHQDLQSLVTTIWHDKRALLKDIWGEGGDLEASLRHAHLKPQTHEGEVFHLHSRLSKGFCDPCLGHDTIWRPGQGDEGICRQRKYVDK